MAHIKGRYDARVTIDFDFDDTSPGFKHFEDIREGVEKDFTTELKRVIEAEVDGFGKVKIRQKCAELHIVDDASSAGNKESKENT